MNVKVLQMPKKEKMLYERKCFALVDPAGTAKFIGDREERCVGEFSRIRKGVILDDNDMKLWAAKLKAARWEIRPAIMRVLEQ